MRKNELKLNMKDCQFEPPNGRSRGVGSLGWKACITITSELSIGRNLYFSVVVEDIGHFISTQSAQPPNILRTLFMPSLFKIDSAITLRYPPPQ